MVERSRAVAQITITMADAPRMIHTVKRQDPAEGGVFAHRLTLEPPLISSTVAVCNSIGKE